MSVVETHEDVQNFANVYFGKFFFVIPKNEILGAFCTETRRDPDSSASDLCFHFDIYFYKIP